MAHRTVPLLPFQQRLWFLQQIETYGHDDTVSLVYQLPDGLSQDLLQERLDTIIQAHDALRLVISAQGDTVMQQVSPEPGGRSIHAAALPVVKNGGLQAALLGQIEEARRAISAEEMFRADLLNIPGGPDLLILTAHRMICDLESLDYIAAQLIDPAPVNGRRHADFVTYAESGAAQARHPGLDRWVDLLRDATHVCELPLDKTRPQIQQGKVASYTAAFSAMSAENVRKLASHHTALLSDVLLAAFFTLLYRYTLQDDILIGLAHRDDGPDLPAVGPLTDVAVIRQQIAEDQTFAGLIGALRDIRETIGAGPLPPFPQLLDALSPVRDLSRSPMIQHGFAFQDITAVPANRQPHSRRVYASAALQQLDVMLSIRAENGGLEANWSYDTALFGAETIARMQGHIEALLASAAGSPGTPLRRLSLITPAELELTTIRWNQTEHRVPDNAFVYRLFEKQAARTPDAIAARQPGATISYAALNRQANRLAHKLARMGVGPDTIVAILADRDIDYLACMLAVNKASGAFLPLSPTYPARRLASIFERSEAPVVLTGANYLDAVGEAMQYVAEGRQPAIQPIADAFGGDFPEDNPAPRCGMHNVAYIMFTSGSTGEPKGVMVHHGGMINHNYAKIGDLGMTAADILAQTSRQSFDIVVWQFLAPLIVGGSIYIMPDETALDPAALLTESDRNGITILQLVPVNIEALLDAAAAMGKDRPRLPGLRWMVPTGDALQTDLCRRWLGLYPHTRMLNTYGATECSDDQCHIAIPEPPAADYRPAVMTIGRPIINTQVYILDEAMQPVPVGVIGELYIAGTGVGPGYLKDPERTVRTFVPNPFSSDPSARLYRSGDQARYLPDGTVEFLGRIGFLIKLRGIRIEPGEIQSVLGRHPQVAQAALVVHEFPGIGAHLVAYVVPARGEVIDEDEVRTYLRQYLPDYMVPSYFVMLGALPLNANGKIDRKALPVPDLSGIKSTIVAPRTPTETTLLDIWRKVLAREEISVYDNFFDVGGYSLLAMRLFNHIERQFGRRLPLATIFRATTIADQAELLSKDAAADPLAGLACVVPIQAGDAARPPFFCVHAGGGHVIFFHGLARSMGADQAFYGIQALGVDGNREPARSFEQFAEVYVDEMRRVQPEGPYYIGGECMGGTIAFEVARQLEAQGEKVGLLVMFDSYCAGIPTLKPGVPMWLYEVMFNIRRATRHYYAQVRATSLREEPGQLLDILKRTVTTINRIFFSHGVPETAYSDPMVKTQAALNDAEHIYKPGVIAAPITLFNSELPWGVTGDETLGWSGHSHGGVEIERLPTLFDMMIEGPKVHLAGERLRKLLDAKFSGGEISR